MKTALQGEGSYMYECEDLNCYYCYKTKLQAVVKKDWSTPFKPKLKQYTKWGDEELILLLENINTHTDILLALFPIRSRESINSQKYIIRKLYGLVAPERQRNRYGYA